VWHISGTFGDKNGKFHDRPGQAEKREAERKRQQLSKEVVRKGWMYSYRVDKDDFRSIRLYHEGTRPNQTHGSVKCDRCVDASASRMPIHTGVCVLCVVTD